MEILLAAWDHYIASKVIKSFYLKGTHIPVRYTLKGNLEMFEILIVKQIQIDL